MTPDKKAAELIEKFYKYSDSNRGRSISWSVRKEKTAKACALICVDEILRFMQADDEKHKDCSWLNSIEYRYYEQVKEKIKQP